jgi:dihydroxyacetone kinase-like protein
MNQGKTIAKSDLMDMIRHICGKIEENKEYLSKLDTEIGDGDHGYGMALGFKSFAEKLGEFGAGDIGSLLKKGGFEIIKVVGGASGAIFGTLFMGQALRYENALKGKEQLSLHDFAGMLTEALCQIKKRGAANVGDKTMVDALEPAVTDLEESARLGLSFREAFAKAAVKAREGAENTKKMVATKGRAKNLAERSLGFADPGAVSTTVIFDAMAEWFAKKNV